MKPELFRWILLWQCLIAKTATWQCLHRSSSVYIFIFQQCTFWSVSETIGTSFQIHIHLVSQCFTCFDDFWIFLNRFDVPWCWLHFLEFASSFVLLCSCVHLVLRFCPRVSWGKLPAHEQIETFKFELSPESIAAWKETHEKTAEGWQCSFLALEATGEKRKKTRRARIFQRARRAANKVTKLEKKEQKKLKDKKNKKHKKEMEKKKKVTKEDWAHRGQFLAAPTREESWSSRKWQLSWLLTWRSFHPSLPLRLTALADSKFLQLLAWRGARSWRLPPYTLRLSSSRQGHEQNMAVPFSSTSMWSRSRWAEKSAPDGYDFFELCVRCQGQSRIPNLMPKLPKLMAQLIDVGWCWIP